MPVLTQLIALNNYSVFFPCNQNVIYPQRKIEVTGTFTRDTKVYVVPTIPATKRAP